MSSKIFLLFGCSVTLVVSNAQEWPPINIIHECNWHEEPHEYRPTCFLSDVHVNTDHDEGVGYLVFGYGRICHYNNCTINPEAPENSGANHRAFTLALSPIGEIEEVRTFTNEPYPYGHQRWNNGNLWTTGTVKHSVQNVHGEIVAIINDGENFTGPGSYTTHQFLYHFLPTGELASEPLLLIEGDPLRFFEMGGVFEDPRDTTYLVYGQEVIRDEPYGEYTSQRSALMKFEPNGALIWSRTYPDSRLLTSVITAEEGGYWAVGVSSNPFGPCGSNTGTRQVIKFSELGFELARSEFQMLCRASEYHIFEESIDTLSIWGRRGNPTENFDPDYPDAGSYFSAIVVTNSEGELEAPESELKEYVYSQWNEYSSTVLSFPDGYLIGGFHWHDFTHPDNGVEMSQQKGMLLKLDENRDSLWTRFYSVMTFEPPAMQHRHWMGDVKPTPDGGFVCVGYIENVVSSGLRTPWVLKVDEHGCLEPGCQYVGVETHAYNLLGSLKAYPNPTSDHLRVNLDLPQEAGGHNTFELVMHDLQGRVVYRQYHPGLHLAEGSINVSDFAPGVYTLHCVIDDVWVDSEKVVISR